MKRIVLSTVFEKFAQDYLGDLRALADNPESRLTRLSNDLSQVGLNNEADYVDVIIHNYSLIVTATPEQMVNNLIPLFGRFSGMDLSTIRAINLTAVDGSQTSVAKKFYMLVTDAMGYNDVQEKVFPKYIKKMGIKSCVYCNAQYAISTKKGKTNRGKAYRSTFTLDHQQPKSKYPFLATTFFNLYPCCSSCNQAKSYKAPIFGLYVKPTDPAIYRNPFVFRLDSYSFVKYSMSGDSEDLEVDLVPSPGITLQELATYEEYFHISKLYSSYNDTVEEVIWKYRMYNKAGRQALKEGFRRLLPGPTDFNRFILGNYDREDDMLKRPLAKLVQDVAKQLGII